MRDYSIEFLKASFANVTVAWFFMVCLYNTSVKGLLAEIKARHLLLLPLAFFFLNILWIIFSPHETALTEIVKQQIHMFLIPAGFLVCHYQVDNKRQHMILIAFVLACILCSVACLSNAAYNAIASKSLFATDADVGKSWFLYSNSLGRLELLRFI